eukprot:scaffold30357_cov52-Phaeocystis_antarctica.AAC.4
MLGTPSRACSRASAGRRGGPPTGTSTPPPSPGVRVRVRVRVRAKVRVRVGVRVGVRVRVRVTPSIDSSTPIISSSGVSTMRLEECEMDSISTFRPGSG